MFNAVMKDKIPCSYHGTAFSKMSSLPKEMVIKYLNIYTSLQTSENKDNYVEEYKAVLKNGFSYEDGKVIEAYYNDKLKEVWFILSTDDYISQLAFTKKALSTWNSYGGEVVPIIMEKSRFSAEMMPKGTIKL